MQVLSLYLLLRNISILCDVLYWFANNDNNCYLRHVINLLAYICLFLYLSLSYTWGMAILCALLKHFKRSGNNNIIDNCVRYHPY